MANGGWETFLSYEDPEQDILIGLLRLRRCSPESFRPELKGGASIVRELHVYGSVVPISSRDPSKFQHQVHFYSLNNDDLGEKKYCFLPHRKCLDEGRHIAEAAAFVVKVLLFSGFRNDADGGGRENSQG